MLDCQVPEQERQWVARSDQFAETKGKKEHAAEQLRRWTQQSAEKKVSSKGETDDEDHFGWCRWRGSWWMKNRD